MDREAGVESATVDSKVDVTQLIRPTLDVGFIDEKGEWKGVKSSDKEFIAFQKDEGIADGANFLTGQIDMTGYTDLFIALKPTRSGNYEITAVMGPDSSSFANLSPVNAAVTLKGSITGTSLGEILNDGSEALTANKWDIFIVQDRLRNQKLLQFKIVNNSGGSSDVETAFMRMV